MYAEGDLTPANQNPACSALLRHHLPLIIDFLKTSDDSQGIGEVNMPLVTFVFKNQAKRFFKTKMLTKNIDADGQVGEDNVEYGGDGSGDDDSDEAIG